MHSTTVLLLSCGGRAGGHTYDPAIRSDEDCLEISGADIETKEIRLSSHPRLQLFPQRVPGRHHSNNCTGISPTA
jgi:hypothetical protein